MKEWIKSLQGILTGVVAIIGSTLLIWSYWEGCVTGCRMSQANFTKHHLKIDSINFNAQQALNIAYNEMEVVVEKDEHGCRYWLRKDNKGGLWWRDKIENNGEVTPTYVYSVQFNRTTGDFQYLTIYGKYKSLVHKWQRGDNNNKEENKEHQNDE